MTKKTWKEQKFSDLVDFPPKVSLTKNKEYSFIPMENVSSSTRTPKVEAKIYTGGGAKFCEKDTIFARITPCLENGKIAQIPKMQTKEGFGSTEYFVFRAKEGVSDPAFIYYLAKSDIIRQPAIKSMYGASGRQRADAAAVADIDIYAPPLETQILIGKILSAYDDLIENNQRRIRILEDMAQGLYREWFVHFRFPGHEKIKMIDSPRGPIPQGWETKPLVDVAHMVMGQSPKSEFYNDSGEGLPFHQGVTDFGVRFPKDRIFCTVENRLAETGDILFSVRAPVGRINIANKKIILGRGLAALRHKNEHQDFLLHQLKEIFFKEDIIGSGSIFNAVTKADMQNLPTICPGEETIQAFQSIAQPINKMVTSLDEQLTNLVATRDFLLPKLISGEIELSASISELEEAA